MLFCAISEGTSCVVSSAMRQQKMNLLLLSYWINYLSYQVTVFFPFTFSIPIFLYTQQGQL